MFIMQNFEVIFTLCFTITLTVSLVLASSINTWEWVKNWSNWFFPIIYWSLIFVRTWRKTVLFEKLLCLDHKYLLIIKFYEIEWLIAIKLLPTLRKNCLLISHETAHFSEVFYLTALCVCAQSCLTLKSLLGEESHTQNK